jgi:uncharacterized protein (TIGR02145 family)
MKKMLCLTLAVLAIAAGCQKKEPAADPSLKADVSTLSVSADAGSQDVSIYTNCAYADIAVKSSDSGWLTGTLNSNVRYVTVKYAANDSEEARTATITLTSGTVSASIAVTQSGKVPVAKTYELFEGVDGNKGMIYWVDPNDATIAKAVSVARYGDGSTTPWGAETFYEATMFRNGQKNTEKIDASNFAVSSCKALGDGWYLPAVYEVADIFDVYNGISHEAAEFLPALPADLTAVEKAARSKFDSQLTALGGTAFNTAADTENGNSYWSSTELDEANAYYVRVGKYDLATAQKKKFTRYVRCVRTFGNYTYKEEPVSLVLTPESVVLEAASGSTQNVYVESGSDKITVTVAGDTSAWCSATLSGKTINVTASSENNTGKVRSAVVVVTAGPETNLTKRNLTVSQQFVSKINVGDVYYVDKVAKGIYYIIDKPDYYYVMALGEQAASYWAADAFASADNNTLVTGATSLDDGYANTQAIIKAAGDSFTADNFPAAYYCAHYDDGNWFLPAYNQLTAWYDNAYSIGGQALYLFMNPIFQGITGASILTENTAYWSSSEYSVTNAWYARPNGKDYGNGKKNKGRLVRCIRRVAK